MDASRIRTNAAASVRGSVFSVVLACAMIAAVLAIRILSPSDIHDQTQPKTVAYTTNIVTHADDWTRWTLPREIEEFPATKPPLYNWLAVPVVALTDGRFEWAHKAPSMLAFVLLAVIIWCIGSRLDPNDVRTRAWAVVVFGSNYMWFKLSYLARPDAILTLFIVTGWASATMLAIEHHRSQTSSDVPSRLGRWKIGIWGSTALALLAKGPAAILVPLYLIVFFWFIDAGSADGDRPQQFRDRFRPAFVMKRSWFALRLASAGWGFPLALVPFALWFYLAGRVNPEHVYEIMIREEVTDRFLGIGEEGTKHGPWDFIRTLPEMPWAFITRFLPWSVFFVGAIVDLSGRSTDTRRQDLPGRDDADPDGFAVRAWIIGSITFTLMTIFVFSLPAGKRGDYIASVFIPASIVVGYWLNHLGFRIGRRALWLPGAMATVTIAAFAIFAWRFDYAVRYPLGSALHQFADEVQPLLAENAGRPVSFYETGRNPIQALLHRSQRDNPSATAEFAAAGKPFWLFVRARSLDSLMRQPWTNHYLLEERARSIPTPSNEASRPVEIILFDVRPINGPAAVDGGS